MIEILYCLMTCKLVELLPILPLLIALRAERSKSNKKSIFLSYYGDSHAN